MSTSTNLDLKGTYYCAAFHFRRTARAVTRLYDLAMQESGVRSTQFAILTAVARMQPVAIGKIGEILLIDATTLTRSLKLMQKEGLLAVSQRSTKRQRFVSLTEAGEKALERSLPLWREIQARFLRELGMDWRGLQSELERVANFAATMDSGPAALPPPL